MKPQQSGFTLVEIAIVLVIIGLLLGGVLKGQDLINSARAKSIITDLRNTGTMITAYQDRFRALPGDDAAASSHLQNTTAAENGNGNGIIEGNFDSVTITDESSKVWAHLRRANLASGDASLASDWQPRNSDGGRIGVTSSAPAAGMNGRIFVCQAAVSGRVAQQVDTSMDDGNPATGSVRFGGMAGVTLTPASTASGPVAEADLFTICSAF